MQIEMLPFGDDGIRLDQSCSCLRRADGASSAVVETRGAGNTCASRTPTGGCVLAASIDAALSGRVPSTIDAMILPSDIGTTPAPVVSRRAWAERIRGRERAIGTRAEVAVRVDSLREAMQRAPDRLVRQAAVFQAFRPSSRDPDR